LHVAGDLARCRTLARHRGRETGGDRTHLVDRRVHPLWRGALLPNVLRSTTVCARSRHTDSRARTTGLTRDKITEISHVEILRPCGSCWQTANKGKPSCSSGFHSFRCHPGSGCLAATQQALA
jgi:hypothetical protein